MTLFRDVDLKKSFSHSLFIALFWGSLWGLAEATLGHILHLLRIPGLAGFVMFPLGVFFMLMAYKSSNNMSVILSTSLVAVTIKLSNIFFPGTSPIDVFKPAFAILCESLVVFVMIFFIKIILANTRIHRIDVEFGIHTFPSDRMKYKKE